MSFSSASGLKEAIFQSIDFIKSRHHPEKPHIAVLSPPHPRDYRLIWKVPAKIREEYDELEEDEDEVLEDLEESLRSRWPGWIFGADFNLEEGSRPWNAEVEFSFYIRTKPDFDYERNWDDSAYTQVTASLRYEEDVDFTGIIGKLRLACKGCKPMERTLEAPNAKLAALVIAPQKAVGLFNKEGVEKLIRKVAQVGLRKAPDVVVKLELLPTEFLSAKVYNRDGSCIGVYHHAFCLLIGHGEANLGGSFFRAYLINLGGGLELSDGKAAKSWKFDETRPYTFNPNDHHSRWALGYLLEVEGVVKFSGRKALLEWDGYGLKGAYPINTLILEEDAGFRLRDYHIMEERLPQIRKSSNPIPQFFERLAQKITSVKPSIANLQPRIVSLLKALSGALADAIGIDRFYTYQEEAIEEILASLGHIQGERRKAVVVTARTAGGKTLAFLVPILIDILIGKLCGEAGGVKAILAYPTKALANDQTEEIATLLFYLKKQLHEVGIPLSVSFGCFHGNTYDLEEVRRLTVRGEEAYLPVKCPVHGKSIYVEENGKKAVAHCHVANCPFEDFLNKDMRKTREEVYFEPPDILITDEDMINRVMSGVSKERRGQHNSVPWYEWQLLGYPYVRCKVCLHTYPLLVNIRKCRVCGASQFEHVNKLSKPRIIVLDEAHQIYGSFGVQVHHMLSLLEHVLRSSPVYVLASATLENAQDFASRLLNVGSEEAKTKVRIVSAKEDSGQGQQTKRIFVVVMPKSYTMDATAIRLLTRFYSHLYEGSKEYPRGIVFTNTLAESNELLHQLRDSFAMAFKGGVTIDGHSTDYGGERAQKELYFKGGEIHLFVATSTLELGVDYGTVDFVMIYGMPAKVSSFVQRMGRAGRNKDAAVFIVFDPDNPLNHTYYENYKILCDGALRSAAIAKEVIGLSPMNEEAVRRATKRWVIAETYRICSQEEHLCKLLVNELSSVDERERIWDEVAKHVESVARGVTGYGSSPTALTLVGALPQSLRRLLERPQVRSEIVRELIVRELSEVIKEIKGRARVWPGISGLVNALGTDFLHNLRAADKEISITYSELGQRRGRELRYVIKHCLPGQVVSYKGLFFVVNDFGASDQKSISKWFAE
ncbi:MAG: DEAD/DEAH box helicase [Acidilobaceae archaeon]